MILRPLSEFKATFNASRLHRQPLLADTIMRADKFAAASSQAYKLKVVTISQTVLNILVRSDFKLLGNLGDIYRGLSTCSR